MYGKERDVTFVRIACESPRFLIKSYRTLEGIKEAFPYDVAFYITKICLAAYSTRLALRK